MNTLTHNQLIPATLAGRCANGYERDQGRRVHLVPYSENLASNGYDITPALCGSKPGGRSAGWSVYGQKDATCPRCIKKFSAIEKAKGGTA